MYFLSSFFQGADNYGTGGYATTCSTLPRHHGGAGGGGSVVVGNNGSTHPQHMLVDSVATSAHPHSQSCSMEWPPYQGPQSGTAAAVATMGRRQNNLPTNIPPPAQLPPPLQSGANSASIVGVGPRGGLTGFRGGPATSTASTSTSNQSLMGYEIPPPFQIPVLEEEAELLPEMTTMGDKIESTV